MEAGTDNNNGKGTGRGGRWRDGADQPPPPPPLRSLPRKEGLPIMVDLPLRSWTDCSDGGEGWGEKRESLVILRACLQRRTTPTPWCMGGGMGGGERGLRGGGGGGGGGRGHHLQPFTPPIGNWPHCWLAICTLNLSSPCSKVAISGKRRQMIASALASY